MTDNFAGALGHWTSWALPDRPVCVITGTLKHPWLSGYLRDGEDLWSCGDRHLGEDCGQEPQKQEGED